MGVECLKKSLWSRYCSSNFRNCFTGTVPIFAGFAAKMGTVPFVRKGTGTFFRPQKGRKNEPVPGL